MLCTHEVIGSIPVVSKKGKPFGVFFVFSLTFFFQFCLFCKKKKQKKTSKNANFLWWRSHNRPKDAWVLCEKVWDECLSGLKSRSWKPASPCGDRGFESSLIRLFRQMFYSFSFLSFLVFRMFYSLSVFLSFIAFLRTPKLEAMVFAFCLCFWCFWL